MNNIYGLTPINGTAAVVTSQGGCTDELTPKQERENLIEYVKQIDVAIMTLPKGSEQSNKKRKTLGLKKLELCKEISKLNGKMEKFSIGIDGRDAFVDCVFTVMREQLSKFQYKQIMRLSRDMYSSDLKIKEANAVVTK